VQLLLTANSPGEVAWIRGLAGEALKLGYESHVILYPCTFATGREEEVLRSCPGVAQVWPKSALGKLFWKGGGYAPGTPLIHLGGDLMYTAILQARWGWRCYSYLWARPWWNRFFAGYFSRNAASTRGLLRRRVERSKIFEVGDLVVDEVLAAVPTLPEKEWGLISFLPGSRPHEIRQMLPFLAQVAQLVRRPGVRFQCLLSPFLSMQTLAQMLDDPVDKRLDHAGGMLEGNAYVLPSGLRIDLVQRDHLQHLAKSQLALSLPGTKTAEAAVLAVPCLTVVPLNCPEYLPSHGLLGLLDWIPGGSRLKGDIMRRKKDKIGLLAQPNQLLGKPIMPELIDHLDAATVADQVQQLFQTDLSETGLLLREAYLQLAGCSAKMLSHLPK
jgi:hypothetical protein